MLRKAIYTAVLGLSLSSGAALAETLLIDNVDATAEAPARGSVKAAVSEKFGEPVTQQGPVGEPPISSWEYEGFVVFFEYDRVLHTVAKR